MFCIQAKKLVESLPTVLLDNATKEAADQLADKIRAAGGKIEME